MSLVVPHSDLSEKYDQVIISLLYQVLEDIRVNRYNRFELYTIQKMLEKNPELVLRRLKVDDLVQRISKSVHPRLNDR